MKEMIEMANTVAVVVGPDGNTSSLLEQSVHLQVFQKKLADWNLERELPVELHPEQGLANVRHEISELIGELGDTRILVAGEISGVAYNAFDTAGYYVFQIPEKRPQKFLEFVLASVEKQQEDLRVLQRGTGDVPQPQRAGEDGIYYLDITQAQANNPNATTKQMLLPFLKGTTFYELTLMCSHIPPWFDREFGVLKLAYDKEVVGPEKYKVIVHPTTCE
ncbi:Nitrogenase iron-iron accessory protein AnfO [Ethanoligenens harbinense YUAN-3]|uniref:Nitrogenase iron-iron accessory protein AnfO n=2 Tax=Ethanoligenens harbinense TaxID=253239 RepID=E6U874_ETHHY|nr:Nitrogenase iron-iron accessory protein AnfO [Ethanoligenens harbinense YUAN-3]